MKNLWTIIKKELIRVFKDPKLFIMVILFPGLLIYGMYSIMGEAFKNIGSQPDDKKYEIYYVNEFPSTKIIVGGVEVTFEDYLTSNSVKLNAEYIKINEDELEEYKKLVHDEKVNYIIEFDKEFDEKCTKDSQIKPYINCYYNPVNDESDAINNKMKNAINNYYIALQNQVYGDTTIFTPSFIPQCEENKVIAKSMSMFLPFLIISFLFSGIMSIAPESIAGEKERNTIATLLVTPVKRTYIALGKVISLSVISILSALSSFLGVMLSLPKLINFSGLDINLNIYSFGDYLAVFAVLLSVCFVLVGILSICSAFAKNIKEASIIMTPLMILSMGISMISMFTPSAPTNPLLYFIPLYNSILMLQQVFNFAINYGLLAITLVSDLVYSIILIVILTRLFNSEKVMFSK